jgi:hypothetical protein
MMRNLQRGKNTRAARFEDFHPYRAKQRPAMTAAQLHGLRGAFGKRHTRRPGKTKPKTS